MELFFDYLG